MKRILAAILLCAAVCFTAGCGGKNTSDTVTDDKTESFMRGKWNGDVFTSDFFGITITLDAACTKDSDAALALQNGLADMSDETFNGAVENSDGSSYFTELSALYHDKCSIGLAYAKLDGKSADWLVRDTANEMMRSAMFKDVSTDTVMIAGEERPCVYTTMLDGYAEIKEIVIVYQHGDYFAVLTLGALFEPDLWEMIAGVLG